MSVHEFLPVGVASILDPDRRSAPTNLSEFQKQVYGAVSHVPPGKVVSYGALAEVIGCGSAQAVGQALKGNPYAPIVPCHRVVAADGGLGGYSGKAVAGAKKRKLLQEEGVVLRAYTVAEDVPPKKAMAADRVTGPDGGRPPNEPVDVEYYVDPLCYLEADSLRLLMISAGAQKGT